ncbi:ATP-binding protein [Vibrio tapetis subsp. quintayensis]|uniref:ATP-binding protein n=1 Tax=Vibrio tapetis TaxID=52443 RepID=UPI0025B57D86|nr:ATP-binding protein [Vibrio tapetis]MDN3680833.1 ATP-binding protein [Vibrio tapetis subsp. quintayensis]
MMPSLFKRLYLGIISGVSLAILLIFSLGGDYFRGTEIKMFVQDGRYFVEQYLQQKDQPDSLYRPLIENKHQRFFIFDLYLIDDWESDALCEDCRLLISEDDVSVFVEGGDLYRAVFSIPNTNQSFLFKEHHEFFDPVIEWQQDPELHFALGLIGIIIFCLGLTIYFPVRQLQNQILKLRQAQQRFGAGSLDERVTDDLTSPVKELANSFNMMADEIESRVKQNQVFTQAIPHEVRTPLSRIQLASDLARSKVSKDDQAMFDNIDAYVEDISTLTSSIVMLSKLNMVGGIQDISTTLVNFPEFCKDRLSANCVCDITFCYERNEEDKPLEFEVTLARLVLDNLLKNACRYGNGQVELRLTSVDGFWIVDVDDNGAGIPIEHRNDIFIAFSRLDKSRNANQGGFGLGLAIATSAAKQLGWTFSVDDSHLGGARFSVLVPKI